MTKEELCVYSSCKYSFKIFLFKLFLYFWAKEWRPWQFHNGFGILGVRLFFINDLFLFIDEAKLANFADDSTIFPNSAEIETLLDILENESEKAKTSFNKMKLLLIQINFKQWFWVNMSKNKQLI